LSIPPKSLDFAKEIEFFISFQIHHNNFEFFERFYQGYLP